jgi:hypothetical protein
MNIQTALKNDRTCKSLTGLSINEFNCLVPDFKVNLSEFYQTHLGKRIRKLGGGRKGKLPTVEDRLFTVLLYLKDYPTFDVLGFIIGTDRTRAFRWVKLLLPVIEKTLSRKIVLPKRQINSIEEWIKLHPELKDIMVDGMERRVNKPKKIKKRNKLYSGKKKSTTRKTIVATDDKRRILILTKTKSGRRHDKKLTDKNQFVSSIPPDVSIWVDTGFQGLQKQHPNLVMPKKATKNYPLTEEEKQNNKLISSIRVQVEHVISGIKRYRSVADVYRNHRPNLDDQFTLLSCGLWNYHLSFS